MIRSQIGTRVAELARALRSPGDLPLVDDWHAIETVEQERWLQFLLRLRAAGVDFTIWLPDDGAVDLKFLSNLIELNRQIDVDGEMHRQLELGEWSPELAEWLRQQSRGRGADE